MPSWFAGRAIRPRALRRRHALCQHCAARALLLVGIRQEPTSRADTQRSSRRYLRVKSNGCQGRNAYFLSLGALRRRYPDGLVGDVRLDTKYTRNGLKFSLDLLCAAATRHAFDRKCHPMRRPVCASVYHTTDSRPKLRASQARFVALGRGQGTHGAPIATVNRLHRL